MSQHNLSIRFKMFCIAAAALFGLSWTMSPALSKKKAADESVIMCLIRHDGNLGAVASNLELVAEERFPGLSIKCANIPSYQPSLEFDGYDVLVVTLTTP